MDQNKVAEAIESLNKAISKKDPVHVRTTMIGPDDDLTTYCGITANKAGFLRLGYRILRIAEGTERPAEKINELLSPDSEWQFGDLEKIEDQAIEAAWPYLVKEPKISMLLDSLSRLAVYCLLIAFLYGVITYFF
jgi:hypothetical protein